MPGCFAARISALFSTSAMVIFVVTVCLGQCHESVKRLPKASALESWNHFLVGRDL